MWKILVPTESSSEKDAKRCKQIYCTSSGSVEIHEKRKVEKQGGCFFFVIDCSLSFFRMRLKSSSSAWLIKDVSRCLFQIKFHFCKLKWIVYLISLNFYMDLDRKHLESWDLQIWITNVKNFLIVDFWTNAVIANYFVR